MSHYAFRRSPWCCARPVAYWYKLVINVVNVVLILAIILVIVLSMALTYEASDWYNWAPEMFGTAGPPYKVILETYGFVRKPYYEKPTSSFQQPIISYEKLIRSH